MKKLLTLSFLLLFGIGLNAQVNFHQTGSKKTATTFAEAPQKFLGELHQLRGFGCFLKVSKSDEQYDNLVGFYQIGKEEEQYLIFFVTAEIVNEKGKVVAKSNTVNARITPNQETILKDLAFPKGIYEELGEGKYELRLSGYPKDKELKEMIEITEPEVRFFFKK